MSTFLELQTEVLAHQFDSTRYLTFIKAFLNEGQKYIVLQTDVRTQMTSSSFNTVAATATQNLPSDFARLIDLTNTTDQNPLEPIALRDYDDLATASGKPTAYTLIGSTIAMYPTPDAVYPLRMRYWKLPATLTANGDIPEIPTQYHHLLVRYAVKRLYEMEHDWEAVAFQQAQFETDLQKMRGEAQYEQQDKTTQLPGTWESGENVALNSVWY